ncbi:hypothetical protein QYF61_001112 [Mycteria americana]|uniref:RNase H type-1 domain-containing protein n=1 Tax=Mycteria americana TaxID=33587 RepID=A0AAN7MIE1_MYCAM|nr:hypothetical protein QYF61_001112 [Mycteria americana]
MQKAMALSQPVSFKIQRGRTTSANAAGKREAEREAGTRDDTSSAAPRAGRAVHARLPTKGNDGRKFGIGCRDNNATDVVAMDTLSARTRGSAGLDVATPYEQPSARGVTCFKERVAKPRPPDCARKDPNGGTLEISWVENITTNHSTSEYIKTLNDIQKLLGNINWIRTQCAAKDALRTVNERLSLQQCHRRVENLPVQLYICNQEQQPLAIIGQWETRERDPLILLEWVFLPYQPTKTLVTRIELFAALIKRGRERIVEMTGEEPGLIILPVVKNYLNWCLQNSLELQMALAGFDGQIDTHHPPHKMFTFYNNVKIENKPLYQWQPVTGTTVFTDGSGKTGKAVITWKEKGQWQHQIERIEGSPQLVELHAITMAFRKWSLTPLNIVSDSQYTVGVVQRIERAQLKCTKRSSVSKI